MMRLTLPGFLLTGLLAGLTAGEAAPQLRVQAGQAGGASLVAVSANGQLLATSGSDGQVLLWEVASRIELGAIGSLAAPAAGVAWSGDAVLAADQAGGLRRFLITGAPTTAELGEACHGLAVLPDGRAVLATASGVAWWDPAGGQIARVRLAIAPVRALAVAGDGAVYAVGDRGLAGLEAGAATTRFERADLPAKAIAVAPDGRRLILGGDGSGAPLRRVDLVDPKARLVIPGKAPPPGGKLVPGAVTPLLKGQQTTGIAFADDTSLVLTVGAVSQEVQVLAHTPPRLVRSIRLDTWPDRLVRLAGSTYVIASHQEKRPRFADLAVGRLEADPRQRLRWTLDLWSSADGRWLAQAVDGGEVRIWDLAAARLHRRVPGRDRAGEGYAQACLDQRRRADGLIAVGMQIQEGHKDTVSIDLIDPLAGRRVARHELPREAGMPTAIASLADGIHAVTYRDGPEATTPPGLVVLPPEGAPRLAELAGALKGEPMSAAFADDGRIAIGGLRWLGVWQATGGQAVWRRELGAGEGLMVRRTLWRADGGVLGSAAAGIIACDAAGAETGRIAAGLVASRIGDWNDYMPIVLVDGGIWQGLADGSIRSWVGAAEQPLRSGAHALAITALHRLADGTVASAAHDGAVVLWRRDGGWTMLAADDGEWVAADRDGTFDGSPGCGRLLAIAAGARGAQIDQLAAARNRPDLLIERLGRGDPAYRELLRAVAERRTARLGGAAGDLADLPVAGVRAVSGTVTAEFTAARGLKSWQLWLDGVPQVPEAEQTLSGATAKVERRVAMPPGRRTIEVSCWDAGGRESLRATATLEAAGQAALPTLHVLAVGVSRYRTAGLDLAYAHQDAIDLAAALARVPKTAFAAVNATVVTDAQATTAGIRAAAAGLAASRPGDTVVVLLAGHGAHAPDGTYCLLTHDCDPADLARTGLPFGEIEALIAAAPALRRLVLLDACESGERDGAAGPVVAAAASPGNSRGLRAIGTKPKGLRREERFVFNDLRRRTGAVVLSSSTGDQLSYEKPELANGLFTQAILESLAGAGDADGDGWIGRHELLAAVARRTAELSGGLQTPVVDRDNLLADLRLPVLVGITP